MAVERTSYGPWKLFWWPCELISFSLYNFQHWTPHKSKPLLISWFSALTKLDRNIQIKKPTNLLYLWLGECYLLKIWCLRKVHFSFLLEIIDSLVRHFHEWLDLKKQVLQNIKIKMFQQLVKDIYSFLFSTVYVHTWRSTFN